LLIIDAAQTANALGWNDLVDALRDMFVAGCEMPVRHHHDMAVPGEANATMLLMPAWVSGEYIGVKLVNVFPDNAKRGLPAISGNYVLSSGTTGEMLAVIDGGELTARRTAAASALASYYLSRKDSNKLLVVGTGRLSACLAQAHSAVRPINEIQIWGRDITKSTVVAKNLCALGYNAQACENLEKGAKQADIVSCATLAQEPIINGSWLKAGAHLDLVGGFRATMREADDNAVKRAHIFVDTKGGCLDAGDFCPGDIKDPIDSGILQPADIVDLYQLTSGEHKGRSGDSDITMFKSVGAALEDLAGAILAYKACVK